MMRGANLRAVALFLVLTACGAAVVVNTGCNAYGDARATRPPLGGDALSAWVAMLDTSMTRVCR
mgnify:CR=1 FL=1